MLAEVLRRPENLGENYFGKVGWSSDGVQSYLEREEEYAQDEALSKGKRLSGNFTDGMAITFMRAGSKR
jgi:hypothetical protein